MPSSSLIQVDLPIRKLLIQLTIRVGILRFQRQWISLQYNILLKAPLTSSISRLTISSSPVYYNAYIFSRRRYTTCLLRDTSVTPYTRLPVSTNLATRDRPRDCRNLRQSTAICRSPPYSTKFHQIPLNSTKSN